MQTLNPPLKPVTGWFVFTSVLSDPKFNHIEDGHTAQWRPTEKHSAHKRSWKNRYWAARRYYLTADTPARLVGADGNPVNLREEAKNILCREFKQLWRDSTEE